MARKLNKRKYTKRNPTSIEKLAELQSNYNELSSKNMELQTLIKNKECQNVELTSLLDRQYEEIAMLRERNVTLIEAVEILARASRIEKQQRDLNRFNRSRNDTVSLTNDCEAGYAHGYEKRR